MTSLRILVSAARRSQLLSVLIVFAACVAVSGGCQQKFADISGSPEAIPIIEREFVSKQPLVVLGVTTDPNYRGGVTYYAVKKPPGTSGPEILERLPLPVGTQIKINKVLRCTNCLFMNDLIADIQVSGPAPSGKPTRLVDLLRLDKDRNQIVLDERFFIQSK